MISRILKMLEELKKEKEIGSHKVIVKEAIEIVQEVAKEYGNGLIPVERELPREHLWAGNMKSYEVFVTYLDSDGKERVSTDNTFNGKWHYFGNRVRAWMPKNAPAPYQKGDK